MKKVWKWWTEEIDLVTPTPGRDCVPCMAVVADVSVGVNLSMDGAMGV